MAGKILIYDELVEKKKRYLWCPFTKKEQYIKEDPVFSRNGRNLHDVQGNEYWDGVFQLINEVTEG